MKRTFFLLVLMAFNFQALTHPTRSFGVISKPKLGWDTKKPNKSSRRNSVTSPMSQAQRVIRMASALSKLRNARQKNSSAITTFNPGKSNTSMKKGNRKLPDLVELTQQGVSDGAHEAGKILSKVINPLGVNYDDYSDYYNTGLGAIGLGFGFYSYYSRKDDFEHLKETLDKAYNQAGMSVVAEEHYGNDMANVNRRLELLAKKITRTNKMLLEKFDYAFNSILA